METRARVLLLIAVLLPLGGCASMKWPWKRDRAPEQAAPFEASRYGDENAAPPRVIEPEVERRTVKVPKIDASNVEIGAFFGSLSIEDFGSNPMYGVRAAYHVTEDFFFRADFGQSTAGRTSFETLGGDIELLSGNQRRFTYYSLSLGYNLLPGEVFLGRKTAMNSGFYTLIGIGSVKFAGDNRLTLNFGAGYRVLPTDWLAIHIGVQDRVFDSDLLGETKVTNNLETLLSATVFF